MIVNRRGLLLGLGSMLAAPAVVHAQNLMPIKAYKAGLQYIISGFDQYGNPMREVLTLPASWTRTARTDPLATTVIGMASYCYVADNTGAARVNEAKLYLDDKPYGWLPND